MLLTAGYHLPADIKSLRWHRCWSLKEISTVVRNWLCCTFCSTTLIRR